MAFGSIFIFIATGYDSIDEYWLRTLTIWKKNDLNSKLHCTDVYIYFSVDSDGTILKIYSESQIPLTVGGFKH